MSATHTDVEMLIAAEIANFDIEPGMTLGEFIAAHPDRTTEPGLSITNLEEKYLCQPGADSCLDWKIVATGDDENASGMYGCMIDDGQGNAIFSFRGSEALGDISNPQFIKDWLEGDAGLIDSTGTYQQERARKFVEKMYEQYGDYYDGFDFTGHSLGGNLAMDAAITAPEGMRGRINQVYGFDSPGFSNEYMEKYADQINEIKGHMKHLVWSPVGALLNSPVGTPRLVKCDDPEGIGRHNLLNLKIINGQVVSRGDGYLEDEEKLREWSLRLDNGGWKDWKRYLGIIGSAVSKTVSGINKTIHKDEEIKISTDNTIQAHYSKMSAVEEIFANTEDSLRKIESVLNDIESTLKYTSAVGFLYKNKIRNASVRATGNVNAISACRSVLRDAISEYKKTDNESASCFEGFVMGMADA